MAFRERPLAALADNDHNPCQHLDDDRIAELATSIDRLGLVSPLAVRPTGDGAVTDTADELEAKIAELDALADRLRVGLEHRFQGTVEGFDARRTYCAYCGQAVTKKEMEGALKAVEGRRAALEGELTGLKEERQKLDHVRRGLKGTLEGVGL